MASDIGFVNYVVEQIKNAGLITYRKMFGEYLVYVNAKPAFLICDNTVFVKILPCVKQYLQTAQKGFPYKEAKEHYIADPDDLERLSDIARAIDKNVPLPKKRKK
ncbi:MAG: TfoX/Sxy family protein [Endomicrobium sp.]|jgi:TfoX/Sxy family transcriptional regulator of competence genes|nr:TfoX/Sxy family protein [Endomicrobium sp.]